MLIYISFFELLPVHQVDKSGNKLATLENNLKKVEKDLTEATASLDADQCKITIERASADIEKLDYFQSVLS